MKQEGNKGMTTVTKTTTLDFSPSLDRFLRYLAFKGECAHYQEANPIRLDMDLVRKSIDTLEEMQSEKVDALREVMPKVPKYSVRKRPKVTHKKDGEPTKKFQEWLTLLRENKQPVTTKELKVVVSHEEPNPNSSDQVKAWLYSLGWEPCTYKFLRDKATGDERQIEQVRKDGELTPSVLRLKEKAPEVTILEGLTVIQHRLGIFKGFESEAIDNRICKICDGGPGNHGVCLCGEEVYEGGYYIQAKIGGLTNTLRFKHRKPCVNLPGVDKPWGKEIRSCLMADDGEVFIGSDMSSLEATCKAHFIYKHDPEYAIELTKPEFDEHLDLAVQKGEVSKEDYTYYTTSGEDHTDKYKGLHKIRKAYKPVNYGGVYGIGAPKLARETGWPLKVAKDMLEKYWERNWAVKKVAEEQYTKEVGGYTWLKNPVSGFWYELRYDKDRFSTLNQGTGVYVFDSWLVRAKMYGYMGQSQFHDETGASVKDPKAAVEALNKACDRLNKDLNLNVTLGIDTQKGDNYAECH